MNPHEVHSRAEELMQIASEKGPGGTLPEKQLARLYLEYARDAHVFLANAASNDDTRQKHSDGKERAENGLTLLSLDMPKDIAPDFDPMKPADVLHVSHIGAFYMAIGKKLEDEKLERLGKAFEVATISLLRQMRSDEKIPVLTPKVIGSCLDNLDLCLRWFLPARPKLTSAAGTQAPMRNL